MYPMPKVSVIIPVYNVEAYLRQCLDSVVDQTSRDIEVVCVDDGSTDGSAAILAEYAAKDPRVKAIGQENAGTHVARKVGVAAASGEWCLFLDPDDWLERDAVEKLAVVLDRTSSAIVEYGANVHAEDERMRSSLPTLDRLFNHPSGTFDRDGFLSAVFVLRKVPGNLIGKIVRAEVCKGVFAAMGGRRVSFQEDLCELFRLVASSESAEIVADRLYNYRVGSGISYRRHLSPGEFLGSFAKFEELKDLRGFCAQALPDDAVAEEALECLETRMAMATLSGAIERLERAEDGRDGVRRLREICSDEVVSAACAEWYRLRGVQLAAIARSYGISDLLGSVSLRQLDYVWRGHNAKLRRHDGEIDELRREVASLRETCQRLEGRLRHPWKNLFGEVK